MQDAQKLTKTVFGEVLAELLEARDMPAAIDYVEGLVEPTSIDGEKLVARIEGTSTEHPGDLGELADRLELSRWERRALAFAFAYEQRLPKTPEIPELTEVQEHRLRLWLRRSDAFNNAYAIVEDNPSPNPRVQQEMLDELRAAAEEAQGNVNRLKREYGFPGY